MAKKFTIGLVQMRGTADPQENMAHAVEKIREASARGAQIICMDELFLGEYFCRTEDADLFNLAEPIPGPATEALAKVAKEKSVVIVASLFERRAAGIYHNTCAVIDADGSLLGKYRKMHIPDDPLYYEKFYFTPGDLGFPNFDTAYVRIGIQICWDQWYPEGSRLTALQGAQVIFY
ncbi:MAG: nitrilase-related carbon-nitrogen hydrolase, partial [Candidatus Acidiferrum sp.]